MHTPVQPPLVQRVYLGNIRDSQIQNADPDHGSGSLINIYKNVFVIKNKVYFINLNAVKPSKRHSQLCIKTFFQIRPFFTPGSGSASTVRTSLPRLKFILHHEKIYKRSLLLKYTYICLYKS